MDDVIIQYHKKPKLNKPILIEGLPGVGNVGKLAAEHLIDELGAEKLADIFSKHFPPQVLVKDDGIVKLVNNELFFKKMGKNKSDLIILVGDYQGLSPEGQYTLSYEIIEEAIKFKVTKIFTLGGYGLGKMVEEPRVLGAATSEAMVKEMKTFGVVFKKGEPGSGIVGASGLLLGLGQQHKMEGVCLMGETSGYFVDPKSAQAVLEILTNILKVDIDFKELETKASQIDKITSQLRDIEAKGAETTPDDLHYIG